MIYVNSPHLCVGFLFFVVYFCLAQPVRPAPSVPPACHTHTTYSLTHNLSTHSLLTHTHTNYSHNLLTHNLSTRNSSTPNFLTHNFLTHRLLTQLAHGDIDLHFAWQAWHLVTSPVTLCGRRGTYGTGLALVARLGVRWAPLSRRLLAWQAWHLVT